MIIRHRPIQMSNDIYITHMIIMIIITCNITLPRRRGSRPDGARNTSKHNIENKGLSYKEKIVII